LPSAKASPTETASVSPSASQKALESPSWSPSPGAPSCERRPVSAALRVDGLRFAYPGGPPILDGVSFRMEAGERLAILGANGAGKSTLLKILSRITEPTSGRAVINGRVGSLLEVGTGIDLHGMDAEEALFRLDLYLNEAFIAGLPRVRVVHGKGMGTLRHVARELLTGHPLVRSFRPGEPAEGGAGVTVAEMESR